MKRVAVLTCFLVVSYSLLAQLAKPVKFKEESFDFGTIAEENGPVSHEFMFTNTSNRPIQILTVKPSCGCTTPGWTKEPILPGKTGSVKAQFDPKGRPGYFNKTLAVSTDFDNQVITLVIKGSVGTAVRSEANELKTASGSLRVKSLSFNLGKVYRTDEFVSSTFDVFNAGTKPVTFSGKKEAPDYIRVGVEPATINPGQSGVIKLEYNGKLKNDYGFQSDNVVLYSDDPELQKKSFTVYATLEDYFPESTPGELAKSPRLQVTSRTIDFGTIKQNESVTREISVVNSGKSPLELRALVGNCSCLTAEAAETTLKTGDSTTLKISFNPQDRKGTQTKSVTVYSNDPQNPVQRITVSAVVN